MTTVKIKRLDDAPEHLPKYETTGSAGMDLAASEDSILEAGAQKIIGTGLAIGLPQGYEAQIRPRSGLAANFGLSVNNSPGTIDSDYTGELMVILINHSKDDFKIKRGMRIAQMVIAPVIQTTWHEVDSLDETNRGANGLGSTGQ